MPADLQQENERLRALIRWVYDECLIDGCEKAAMEIERVMGWTYVPLPPRHTEVSHE